jgi:transcriptional regulator with AAA-type ATPase domain
MTQSAWASSAAKQFPWPGNLREMLNKIQRLIGMPVHLAFTSGYDSKPQGVAGNAALPPHLEGSL